MAGAEIRLLGTGRSVWTDSSGAFVVENLTADTVTLAYWAPWLDSLQLPPLRAQVRTAESVTTVSLRTPTFSEYHLSRCGYSPRDGEALIVGEVAVAGKSPAAKAIASAQWRSLTVSDRTVHSELRATVDTVSDDGSFALCGVPIGEMVELRSSGAARSGPMVRVANQPLIIERWVAEIAQREAPSVLVTGRAVREREVPVANAIVELYGDSTTRTRTRSDGSFWIGPLASRSQTLIVRAIGSLEASVDLHPVSDTSSLGDLMLRPSAAALNPVVIEAERVERAQAEFEERRRGATGYFITDEMLKGIPQISSNTLAAIVPRLASDRRMLKLRRGFGFCPPRFFDNGIDLGRLDDPEQVQQQWDLIERAKRVEVYTANQTPPRFNDNDGCGSIVVWTR